MSKPKPPRSLLSYPFDRRGYVRFRLRSLLSAFTTKPFTIPRETDTEALIGMIQASQPRTPGVAYDMEGEG